MPLTFENPHAFWLLLLLPFFIVLKVLGDLRARRAAARIASPRLADSLVVNEGRGRSWLVLTFELLALVFFTSTLARPQYGVIREESPGVGKSLIIAIDTSRSMDAADLKPSRLARAQMAAEDLIKRLQGYRIGLMPFAGSAIMYAPITPDTDAVLDCVQDLDTSFVANPGSNLSRAIDTAVETFERADLSGQQAMVIFSDGEELQGEVVKAAERAKKENLVIICVGVGTPQGGPIENPEEEGGFHRDRSRKPVMTRLQKDVLVRIADITGGLYLSLDSSSVSDARIDSILSKLQRSEMKTKVTEIAVDRYRWPLVAGIISLVIAFLCGIVRRHRNPLTSAAPALALLMAGLLMAPGDSAAQNPGELLPAPRLDEPAPPATAPEAGSKKPSLRATPPSELPPSENRERPAPKTRSKKAVAPASEEERAAGEKALAAAEEREPDPKKGDPWRFYDTGDWPSAVFNFNREIDAAVVLQKDPEEVARLHMARGAAAYKGASRKADKFDNHMMDQAIESFGTALGSASTAVRESAHYNLANAIYEKTKAAEKLRAENLEFAKQKKNKKDIKRFSVTIPYLDKTIRLLENSAEHYQEALVLNENNAPAKKNYEAVTDLIKKLRDIRKQKSGQSGKSKSKSKGEKSEGEGEGEGEGSGSGKGKKKSKAGAGGEEEMEEGEGGEDEEMEGDGEGEEEGGGEGEGEEPGKGQGENEGEGKGGKDETNKEFEGDAKTEGDTGDEGEGEGDGDGEGEAKGSAPGSGGGADEIARKLRDWSQEIRDRIRPRNTPKERRPDKDW